MFAAAKPLLANDFQVLVVRAHRVRGAFVAGLLRQAARWISTAAG